MPTKKKKAKPAALKTRTARRPEHVRAETKVHVVRDTKKLPPETNRSIFIGSRIREMRKAQSLTLQELSALSNLSPGHLSQLERNQASPSITALAAIAEALKVNLHWFFANENSVLEDNEINYVVRKHDRRRLVYQGDIVDELLSPNLARQIEFLHCIIPAGTGTGDEAYVHIGEDTGYIMQGSFELWVGERYFLLHEGDSFAYSSEEPHRYRNPGPGVTIVLWAITPPTY